MKTTKVTAEDLVEAQARFDTTAVKLEHPAAPPGGPVPSVYAPKPVVSTANTLDHVVISSTVIVFKDPITEVCEISEFAANRITAQRLMETVFLSHHPHVVRSCEHGDITSVWSRAQALCVGDDTTTVLKNLDKMAAMMSSPPGTWTELARTTKTAPVPLW